MSHYRLKIVRYGTNNNSVEFTRVYGGTIRDVVGEFEAIFPYIGSQFKRKVNKSDTSSAAILIESNKPFCITRDLMGCEYKRSLSKLGNPSDIYPHRYLVQIYKQTRLSRKIKLSFYVTYPILSEVPHQVISDLLNMDISKFNNLDECYQTCTWLYDNVIVDASFMRVF